MCFGSFTTKPSWEEDDRGTNSVRGPVHRQDLAAFEPWRRDQQGLHADDAAGSHGNVMTSPTLPAPRELSP
jgi:hypothetical protein